MSLEDSGKVGFTRDLDVFSGLVNVDTIVSIADTVWHLSSKTLRFQ
jgi:hypothetical protein